MCGFAGVIGRTGEEVPLELVERMADCLRHRGPDDQGSYAHGPVAFAFRRLSILDLSPAGHQPLVSPDGQVVLVFNGEIHNYAELRSELRTRGHEFRSTGDTEVLLAAYLEWGVECLPRLNGMWAFLIHDRHRGVVFGSRDRFGIKPLYHARVGYRHYFGSEIKALQEVAPVCREVAWPRVARFLAAGQLEAIAADTGTFFSAVHEVAAGSWFLVRQDGAMEQGRYWELPEEEPEPAVEPVGAFRDLFMDAVELQLRSDVPVGVALSGGMDSTAIISAMARLRQAQPGGASEPLHAFSYLSPGHDETRFVASTLEQTGATRHTVEFSPERWWQELPAVLRYHDEPVHSATASVGFAIYRAAAQAGVRVVLVGQGADETLGGYPSFFDDQWYSLLRQRKWGEFRRQLGDFSRGHRGSRARGVAMAMLRYLLITADQFACYRALRATKRRARGFPNAGLLSPELAALLPANLPAVPSGLRAALREGTERSPLPLYLRIEDRNSMAHSVEARLPFLDHRLVSLAFRLSGHWKIRGRWNKYLLREATRGLVPEVVRTRVDKMGFPTQMGDWLRRDLPGPVGELLSSPAFRQRGVCSPVAAKHLLAQHVAGGADHGLALFNLAQTELWLGSLGASRC